MLEITPKTWYREGYCVSTDHALLQAKAINAAFDTDMLYWCKAMALDDMVQMLRNSLCFGMYKLPQSTSEIAGQRDLEQIGFARIVTDGVTFAYLTDVYILPEHQGNGLGQWLTRCMDETFQSWPLLRRMLLITSGSRTVEFYRRYFGMELFDNNHPSGLVVMGKRGCGSVAEQ